MILNPSHDITSKGLPSEIFDAYVRYKKGTRAIVSWLIQFGPAKHKGARALPIKELTSLAKAVTKSIRELPEIIHFHFKETIAARKRLSQFFRQNIDVSKHDFDTANHEHFTASLTQIYSDLCDHCQSISRAKSVGIADDTACSTHRMQLVRNHYACLCIDDANDSDFIGGEEAQCDDYGHKESHHCPESSNDGGIEMDDMSAAIESVIILERVYEIFQIVELWWQRAGQGQVYFFTAAAATNVAWSILRDFASQLRSFDASLSLSTLLQRFSLSETSEMNPNMALWNVHALLEQLAESEQTIAHDLNNHSHAISVHNLSCIQTPNGCFTRTTDQSGQLTINLPRALMDGIIHLICRSQSSSIIAQSSPVYADIGYILTHRDDKSMSFQCTLALHLLSTTYKSYLTALPITSNVSRCRITSLKFSQQAASILKAILSDKESFPCRCPETLAHHMSLLADGMETFSKERCWDLYFQSPWVAGNHAIEMLDTVSYYGMRLFHHKHYVASIVHGYSVLVQLAGLEEISVLEDLIETFKDVFFPTGRPGACFENSWARYIGARLKFKKNTKKGQKCKPHGSNVAGNASHEKKDGWCMVVPAHTARNAAGILGLHHKVNENGLEPKFDYGRIDPLIRLKQRNWRVFDTLARPTTTTITATPVVNDDSNKGTTKPRNSTSTSSRRSSSGSNATDDSRSLSYVSCSSEPTSTASHPSQSQSQTTDQEFLSMLSTLADYFPPLPSSPSPLHEPHHRMNTTTFSHALVYTTMLDLIKEISVQLHPSPSSSSSSSSSSPRPPTNCICFVHTLLSAADRIVDGRKFGPKRGKQVVECWSKDEREVVDVVKSVLRTGLVDKDVRWEWDL